MNNRDYFNIINNLPKTDEQLNKQKKYEIFMGIMIVLPLVIAMILFILSNAFIAFTVLFIGYGITVIFGINKRKKTLNDFFKIKEAHKNINIIKTTDEGILKSLYESDAFTFVGQLDDKYLDFVYNWLNNQKVLKDKILNLYVFNGNLLRDAFKINKYSDKVLFSCISLKELDLKVVDIKKFSEGHFIIGSRWLDDIIDNVK